MQDSAVAKIIAIKGRSVDKGLIVIGADASVFSPEIDTLSQETQERIQSSWPGRVTWIVPTSRFSNAVTGGRATVAIRVPDHAQARSLAGHFAGPLISTSANLVGDPPIVLESKAIEFSRTHNLKCVPGECDATLGPSAIFDAISNERLR